MACVQVGRIFYYIAVLYWVQAEARVPLDAEGAGHRQVAGVGLIYLPTPTSVAFSVFYGMV